MLLGLIFFGLFLYGLMYFAFSSYTSNDNAHSNVALVAYERLRDMVFHIPASWPLATFKFILMGLILYAVIEHFTSAARREKNRRARRR